MAIAPAGDTPPSRRGEPLVGRHGELQELDRLLALTTSRPTPGVEIVGDPGIGKTRLLAELGDRGRAAGRPVLWGRASEFERHVPFSIIHDAFECLDMAAVDQRGALAALGPQQQDLLRTAFPALATGTAAVPAHGPGPGERYRLHRAIREFLVALSSSAGLVVVLDDLHWADDASVEVIEYLLRRPLHGGPWGATLGTVLLAVAHRPRQTPSRLRHALASARHDGRIVRLELQPLTPADVEELLPDHDDPRRRQRLYAESGGNPLYLQALLARDVPSPPGARPPGAVPPGGACAQPGVPERINAALSAEVDALTPRQLVVARAVAVSGDGVHPELIARTAALPPADVLPALDELVGRDLIRTTGSGGRFMFRHPLIRRVVYDGAPPGWRVAAHARAATALRQSGATATEIASHLERSAARGDDEAVAVLRQAAESSLHQAPASAAHWLRTALHLTRDDPATIRSRVDLLLLQARALGLTGQFQDSRATLDELRRLLPLELTEQRAQIAATCAMMERNLGRHAEARAQLLAELQALPDMHGRAALVLQLGLADGVVMGTDPTPCRDWPEEALRTAKRHPDRLSLAFALAACVLNDHRVCQLNERTALRLDQGAAIVDALTDGELAENLGALAMLSSAELCHERLDDAIRHLARALRIADATGQSHLTNFLHSMLGAAYLLLGRLERAAGHLADELDAALLTDSPWLRSLALRSQCLLAVTAGNTDTALRAGQEAMATAQAARLPHLEVIAGPLGAARLLAGEPAACVELMLRGGPRLGQVHPVERANWYQTLAAATAATGQPAEAIRWADQAFAHAGGLPRRTGMAHLARAHALVIVDPLRAAQDGARAASLLAQAGDRVGTGHAHVLCGTAFSDSAEVERARAHFGAARTVFAQCGAPLLVEYAQQQERRANARQPRRRHGPAGPPSATATARAGADVLTARERQVAHLVTQGLTNAQIAESLVLSPKTVAVHVSRVLAKLGASRRAGVAGRLLAAPQPPVSASAPGGTPPGNAERTSDVGTCGQEPRPRS
ncbi:MAG TPA: AAA family ATPase [Kineosporiaceae bacterium]